jgi:hypothetical protein
MLRSLSGQYSLWHPEKVETLISPKEVPSRPTRFQHFNDHLRPSRLLSTHRKYFMAELLAVRAERSGNEFGMNQSKSGLRVLALTQVHWRFGKDHLKGGSDMRLFQMSSHGGSVALADDDMDVERGTARGCKSNIADHGGDLHLLTYGNPEVFLLFPVEIEQHRIAERAYRSDLRGADALLLDERLQYTHDLFA